MSQSLCWSCSNCSPLLCEWVKTSNGSVPVYVTSSEVKVLSFDAYAGGVATRCKKVVRTITGCDRYSPDRGAVTAPG